MYTIYHNNEYIEKTENEITDLYLSNKLTEYNNIKGNNEFNLGVYYHFIEENYELAKIYYIIAIDNNNSYAMNYLGFYYFNVEKNYELMKKYYLIAIDNNNSYTMYNLAVYYVYKEQNYELGKKYYLMAINNNNSDAMNNLGLYYRDFEKNYELAKKYFLMAINTNNNYLAKEYLKSITTPLERFILYKQNNINFDEEITKDINIYNNKINNFSKEEKCLICLEINKCIPLECYHHICINCYPKVYNKSCSVCRL